MLSFKLFLFLSLALFFFEVSEAQNATLHRAYFVKFAYCNGTGLENIYFRSLDPSGLTSNKNYALFHDFASPLVRNIAESPYITCSQAKRGAVLYVHDGVSGFVFINDPFTVMFYYNPSECYQDVLSALAFTSVDANSVSVISNSYRRAISISCNSKWHSLDGIVMVLAQYNAKSELPKYGVMLDFVQVSPAPRSSHFDNVKRALSVRHQERHKFKRGADREMPEHKIKSVSNSKRALNVVGGEVASPGQFPFSVFVKFHYPEGTEKKCNVCSCGGFLLAPDVVATAAHCFDGYVENGLTDATNIMITAGVVDHTDESQGQRIRGLEYQRHPEYIKNPAPGITLGNDYAFIRTETPFELNDNVKLIDFATSLPENGETVYLATWGNTQGKPAVAPNEMNFAGFPFLDFESCQEKRPNLDAESMICISETPELTACNGDSGGALFTTSDINNPTDAKVIGLTSFGSSGCTALAPTVFANCLTDKGAWLRNLVSDQEVIPSAQVEVSTFE